MEVFEKKEKNNEGSDDKDNQEKEEEEEEDSFLKQFEEEESDNNTENNNEKWEEDEIIRISNEILNYYIKNKEKFNIYNLSKMCRIYKNLHFQLGQDYMNDILQISYFLSISQDRILELNESIIQTFLDKYDLSNDDNNKDEENYFYIKSKKLKNFFVLLYICFLTHTHICIEGNTGVGKTACAKALSNLLKKKFCIQNFSIFSFHNETESNDFYGTLTINENKRISFCNGPLTQSILSDNIFIAGELNLSPENIMSSIEPVLEECFNSKIYIPGLSQRVLVNNKFLFIACQNFATTLGRKQYPTLLKRRIKILEYPEEEHYNESYEYNGNNICLDFQDICVSINEEMQKIKGNDYIGNKNAQKIAEFIQKFNRKKLGIINDLNLRDVKKLFKRIYYQKENRKNYIGFNLYSNIFFYIISQVPHHDKYFSQIIHKELIPLLADIFGEDNTNIENELKHFYQSKFEIDSNNYLKINNYKIKNEILFEKKQNIEKYKKFK